MRQMNLEKNRDVEPAVVMEEFNKNRERERIAREIPGVGSAETQLSLFDADDVVSMGHPGDDIPGTFLQKKSRRA